MQDLFLVLALIGVIVGPVLFAARIGGRKTKQTEEAISLRLRKGPARVTPIAEMAKRKATHRAAVL